ncbi:MAG TPA: hypothetical protein VH092_07840, partial [Urbifossiella sp.]|nr:hypothetical protein [Urbifossiella sp.]
MPLPRTRASRRRFVSLAATCLMAGGLALLPAGCGGKPDAAAPGSGGGDPGKVKVAYLGLTCEAPIFVAQDKGMF